METKSQTKRINPIIGQQFYQKISKRAENNERSEAAELRYLAKKGLEEVES